VLRRLTLRSIAAVEKRLTPYPPHPFTVVLKVLAKVWRELEFRMHRVQRLTYLS
jgi:hypothetical protein